MTDTIKPRDISDELVERVARELRSFYSCEPVAVCDGVAFKAARAIIAMTLEEAAKVCDEIETAEHRKWKQHADMMAQGASDGAGDCAAAIRSLMKETPNA